MFSVMIFDLFGLCGTQIKNYIYVCKGSAKTPLLKLILLMYNKEDKILIIGAGGQIGTELTEELSKLYGSSNVIAADLKPIVPMLVERHDARVKTNLEWQNFAAEIADARAMRAEKTVSLNEEARKKQRDEEEAKRKARESASATPSADPAHKTQQKIMQDTKSDNPKATTQQPNATAENGGAADDDGLQPDERGIENDIKREQAAKEKRDVVLDEAAHILADEISLIRTDTKLASRVLPRGVVMPAEVD